MTPPVVLSIAGYDPSSGAGVTADLKVFAAHGCFGVSCPTLLTVQSTTGVLASVPADPSYVLDALRCLEQDMPIAGVKLGALGHSAAVHAVAEWLSSYLSREKKAPVVLDPVLRASSGALLLEDSAMTALRGDLLPLCTVITPNVSEARLLAGWTEEADRVEHVPSLACAIQSQTPQAAVVITGGDLQGEPRDYLLPAGSVQQEIGEPAGVWFDGPRVETTSTHGTGCAFSSALLCALVQGDAVESAVASAKLYVRRAMETAYPLGKGRGPIHHLFAFDRMLKRSDAQERHQQQSASRKEAG